MLGPETSYLYNEGFIALGLVMVVSSRSGKNEGKMMKRKGFKQWAEGVGVNCEFLLQRLNV